jgi:hypothetical protein
MTNIKFNTKILSDIFDVSDIGLIEYYQEKTQSCSGKLNPFFNKRQSEKTKKRISEKLKKRYSDNPELKQSLSRKGEKNGMYGKKRSGNLNPMFNKKQTKETKKKISEKAIERYKTSDNPRKGAKLSDEQKRKISEANSKTFIVKNPDGKIITIKNLTKFCEENNLNSTMISRVSKGAAKNHKGYTKP